MAVANSGQSSLVHSLAALLRNDGDLVLDGSSTLTLLASSLQQLIRLFEQYLLSRSQLHGFLALPSHPADTASLLQLQFLFDVLQKTISLKLINPQGVKLQSVVKIFPFKSLKCLELKRIPPHCLEGLRGVYSQLEVFTCSKSLSSLEELLSLCGGDLSSALPWLELHTLNFSYNSIVCLDQSLSLLNVLKSLDLSHNKIQECAEFLKPLSELEHLNLGYNCLQRAPTLGQRARAKLLTLVLRNNELETINGVEQLSLLQHLDLAYNLLLEHSQLAPLSMLHCLNTLSLQGNPLYFKKTHRTCTVRHLSPKAANLRLKLDGTPLSSSELSVLPRPGQLRVPVQSAPPAAVSAERSQQDVSSGAGELSDSMSVGDVAVSHIRRKKSKGKVKVRRASISEPTASDTDYDPRPLSSSQNIVLPHKQEIERMSSFRDQLGEDWLRYQHHLDGSPPSTNTNQPPEPPPPLTNGLNAATRPSSSPGLQPSPLDPGVPEVPEVLPPPLLSSEPRLEASVEAEQETESTLQWPGHSSLSTLEDSVVDGLVASQDGAESPEPSPESQRSARRGSGDTKEEEEEEEELGVDLCHPLLVGVLSEEEDSEGGERRSRRREVFLRIKPGLVLEVDVHRGRERCRLELGSLARVESTEASWSRGETEEKLPAVELLFDYINREKRRRCYVLLDDHPQEALQALTDVLSRVAEENQQRDSELRPSCVRLQCLRCRSEFTRKGGSGEEEEEEEEEAGGERKRRRGAAMLPEGEEEQEEEELTEEDSKANSNVCPECGSDHVVQLAGQSTPYSSTPVQRSPRPESEDDRLHGNQSAIKDDYTDASISSSPILEAATATTATEEDPSFFTAQGSSFFIGDGPTDTSSLSYNTECQSKEDLAGSYRYTAASATPPEVQAPPARSSTPNDVLDLLSEDYEAVDHRLQLFLDVEVFEEEEELHSFLKMSAVKFGEPGEVPSLLVVSNQRIYFLEMTSEPHGGQLSDWLQKRDSHPILELSYLEVGLGSQTIHMEFGGVAYTLLVRDSLRCKRFFGLLTGIVREMAHKSDSKLESISTSRLTPQHHLWPLVCEDIQADVEDGQLQFFYIMAFVLQEDVWTPLTVLATRETLYLLREDHQWRKSCSSLTENENQEPTSGTFSVLETLPISCVSSVLLFPAEQNRIDIKLFDETEKQEKTWCVRSECGELLQGLLAWVRAQWEAMFGVKLHTSLQDKAA
ncbi:LOW QUALITY PROTEIN: serine/threonine-protein kinase 11-interacting protein [Centropristis striata]|uniref:LOW QUALITY PROTEIN: serine/threonine-protein kinase 11-interacting protein n=1 Tax=Centropristis striata TaxID=184440 RepID=UPI0027E12963|nr:LOW QUALITY PROTEIN: serine/threonine-protein kinase 11-interacting protein [Centropristis striata]